MSAWNIAVLKRWFERNEQDQPQDNEQDGPQPGGQDEQEQGQDEQDGPQDEQDGEGEGEGAPQDGEGQDGDSDAPEGEDAGEGGNAQGKGKGLHPDSFANLDALPESEVRDPNLDITPEAGDPSAAGVAGQLPVVILDPSVDVVTVDDGVGQRSTQEWAKVQRGLAIKAAALRQTLRQLLQKSNFYGKQGGLREGRLTGRGVTRLLNGAENVFERRFVAEGESVAVSLLIDRSGSMAGRKMRQAAEVALLLGETASAAGAKLEVIAFDSSHDRESRDGLNKALSQDTGKKWLANGADWLYADPSAVYICKTYAQPIGHLRKLFTTIGRMADGGTNDTSAVKWAGERLMAQMVNRRILFVIEDGAGDGDDVFRSAVTKLEQQGVIVIGIGIGCTARFNRRFTHSITIEDSADLCGKAFALLVATIVKARKIA